MGQLKPCEACGVAKAKQKAVAKTTNVVAEKPCEQLFCDISGPFTTTLGGNRYWIQVVDDYTWFGWVHFCKKKNEMGPYMKSLVETLAGMGHKVAYIRCDNAGENEKPLETLCNQNGATLELTAPDTPQQNGVVEKTYCHSPTTSSCSNGSSRLNKRNARFIMGRSSRNGE